MNREYLGSIFFSGYAIGVRKKSAPYNTNIPEEYIQGT